jgi:predicted O-linked N-acetylglucosamine transferase (SPINDLY family)
MSESSFEMTPSQRVLCTRSALQARAEDPELWFDYVAALVANGQTVLATQLLPQARQCGFGAAFDAQLTALLGGQMSVVVASGFQHALTLLRLGDLDAVKTALENVVRVDPDHFDALCLLGNVLVDLGHDSQAVDAYRHVVRLRPGFTEAHERIGDLLTGLRRYPEALASFRAVLGLNPRSALAHTGVGLCFFSLGHTAQAIACYEQAIQCDAAFSKSYAALGVAWSFAGQSAQALDVYQRGIVLHPTEKGLNSNYLFTLASVGAITAAAYLDEARQWDVRVLTPQERRTAASRRFVRAPHAGRRLRVGYMSGDFCEHAVSQFLLPVVSRHSRHRIELFAYSSGLRVDGVTGAYRARFDHWRDVAKLGDDVVVQQIERDQIDVLIDLSGHTGFNRLGVVARRAAPVQAHYLGYFASTGLAEMDYLISDEVLASDSARARFSESLWRLPRPWVSYQGRVDAPAVNEDTGLERTGILCLGSFNNLTKLTPATLTLWARVLRALPHAKLLLKAPALAEISNVERITETFLRLGVDPARLDLRGATADWASHMALYRCVDIALDPVGGVGGGTTTCDALWMGVPVITLVGDCFAQRMTSSMLSALGRQDWIAASEEEYISKVVALAGEPAMLRAVRISQRKTMRGSPLCDASGLASALEDAFEAMFVRWQQGAVRSELVDAKAACFAHIDDGSITPTVPSTRQPSVMQIQVMAQKSEKLWMAGKDNEAIAVWENARQRWPHCPELAERHGDLLNVLSRFAEAEDAFSSALSSQPDSCTALLGQGMARYWLGWASLATESYQQVIAMAGKPPTFVGRPTIEQLTLAHTLLGASFDRLGAVDDALREFDHAIVLSPQDVFAHSNRLFVCAFRALGTPADYLSLAKRWDLEVLTTAERQQAAARTFKRQRLSPSTQNKVARASQRRLRVGYVSGDLCGHAVARFIETVWAQHDHGRIELHAFYNHTTVDAVTKRLKKSVDYWHPISSLSDEQVLLLIARLQIDVLIDLSGHTAHNRMAVFAHRAAPVQAHYVGYFATTGLTEMDYYIGDEAFAPPGTEAHFAEQLWRLARNIHVYSVGSDAPNVNTRGPLTADGAVGGTLCLGCFNTLAKLTSATLRVWAMVLRALPQATLLLKTKEFDDPVNQQRLTAQFLELGVSRGQIQLRGSAETWTEHMAMYHQVDIALDPIGANTGVTTTCDALWMGVPVVTLAGDRWATRGGASLLQGMGHPEWVAVTEEDYVDKVLSLAADPALRQRLRTTQRQAMAESPLCDAKGLARALEDAYFGMLAQSPRVDWVS